MKTAPKILTTMVISVAMHAIAVAQPRFDAASIRPTQDRRDESMMVNPGGIIYSRVRLHDVVEAAYGVMSYQVSGPAWLESDAFDINGRAEGTHSREELMQMLQTLLADRFKLALHREQKELPVYTLLVGKNGPKLRAAEEDGEVSMGPAAGGIGFQRITMTDFASRFLSRLPPIGRPVIDKTGLPGRYDFTLSLAPRADAKPDDMKRAALEEGFSLFAYALDQIGLRLEAQRAVIDLLVIDHIERVPTEN
jgi:uncharacterized protein (TIGR03435 family)